MATKAGFQGRWLWELPTDGQERETDDDRPF